MYNIHTKHNGAAVMAWISVQKLFSLNLYQDLSCLEVFVWFYLLLYR